MNLYNLDNQRNPGKMPLFQKFFRKSQDTRFTFLKFIYLCIFSFFRIINCIELSSKTKIGGGLYIGHPYCITINPKAVIGNNCNIHKGVTIGMENRGKRKGTPVIGNCVWIGVNATIVGSINIGDDVPSHSIVFGNPCIIRYRDKATEGYINNRI